MSEIKLCEFWGQGIKDLLLLRILLKLPDHPVAIVPAKSHAGILDDSPSFPWLSATFTNAPPTWVKNSSWKWILQSQLPTSSHLSHLKCQTSWSRDRPSLLLLFYSTNFGVVLSCSKSNWNRRSKRSHFSWVLQGELSRWANGEAHNRQKWQHMKKQWHIRDWCLWRILITWTLPEHGLATKMRLKVYRGQIIGGLRCSARTFTEPDFIHAYLNLLPPTKHSSGWFIMPWWFLSEMNCWAILKIFIHNVETKEVL